MEQLNRLHQLLQRGKTGPPAFLSRKLGISKSKLYVILEYLRMHGAVIAYSRRGRTFYYQNDFLVDIRCVLRPLKPGECT